MTEISLTTIVHRLRRMAADEREEHNDPELLHRYVESRDSLAFEVLVWRHAPVVLGVCRRLLRHEQDVEDVFQATFLALARQARSIQRRQSLPAWLHVVACRFARKVQSQRRLASSEQLAALPAVTREEAEWNDLRAVLDEEVNRLPSHYRQAFILCCLEGLTNTEAARELGCAKGTIDSRLAWARKRLQARLSRRGIGLGAVVAALATPPLQAAITPAIELVQQTLSHLEKLRHPIQPIELGNPTIERLLGETMPTTSSKWIVATTLCALAMAIGGLGWAMSTDDRPQAQLDPPTAGIAPPKEPLPTPPSKESLSPVSIPLAPEPAPAPRAAVQTHPFSFTGSILAPDGKPVKNATLYFITDGTLKQRNCPDGTFSFKDEPIPVHEDSTAKAPTGWFRLVATSPELGFVWGPRHRFITRPPQRWELTFPEGVFLGNQPQRSFSLQFRESSPCEGRITDEAGKPVASATVRIQSCEFVKQEDNPDGSRVVGDPFVPENREDTALTTQTDQEGRFRLLLPKESRTVIRIERPEYAPLVGWVDNSTVGKKPEPKEADDRVESPVWVPPVNVKLARPRTITIRVVDDVTKQPLAGVKLIAYLPPLTSSPLAEGVSNNAGVIAFRLPPGRFWLWGMTREVSLTYFPTGSELKVENEAEQKRTFQVKRGQRLTIEVVDADTGKGIPNVFFTQTFAKDKINALNLGESPASGVLETLAELHRGEFKVEPSLREGQVLIDGPKEWIKDERGEPIKLRFRIRQTRSEKPGRDR